MYIRYLNWLENSAVKGVDLENDGWSNLEKNLYSEFLI
jgi:hypothetical protein